MAVSDGPLPRWTREQIRAARVASLLPLLQKRGLQLIEKEAGNFELAAYPGLILKDSGAGPSATSPATPLTSLFRSSASLSTTPCARSPAPKGTSAFSNLRFDPFSFFFYGVGRSVLILP